MNLAIVFEILIIDVAPWLKVETARERQSLSVGLLSLGNTRPTIGKRCAVRVRINVVVSRCCMLLLQYILVNSVLDNSAPQ